MHPFFFIAFIFVVSFACATDTSDFVDSWYTGYECSGLTTSSSTEYNNANCFVFCLAEDNGEGGCCYFAAGSSLCTWLSNDDGSISIDEASANAKRVRWVNSEDVMCSGSSGLTITDNDDGTERTFQGLGCASAEMFDYSHYSSAPGGPYPAIGQNLKFTVALPLTEKDDSSLSFKYSISDLGSATGLTLDGVAILAPPTSQTDEDAQTARVYDSCNAHADGSQRYHYHAYPLCLGRDLGLEVPDESVWTIFTQMMYDEDYDTSNMKTVVEKWISQWPETGTATKLGYMRDGHPIYSPYNDDGELIKYGSLFNGSDTVTYMEDTYTGVSDWATDLDVCNGYTASNGEYRYVFTPSPPWTISCYKGTKDYITSNPSTSDCQCPDAGLCYDGTDDWSTSYTLTEGWMISGYWLANVQIGEMTTDELIMECQTQCEANENCLGFNLFSTKCILKTAKASAGASSTYADYYEKPAARTYGGKSCASSSNLRVDITEQKVQRKLKRIENLARVKPASSCLTDDNCNHNEACKCTAGRKLLFGGPAAADSGKCGCKYLD